MTTAAPGRTPPAAANQGSDERGISMNFRQLEYVVEVNRCGSINRAAQALFISQPALSSAIRELESELGFPVFVRSSRGKGFP